MTAFNSMRTGPDEQGRFGIFGGRFVAETLMPLILDLEAAYRTARADPAYLAELDYLGKHYTGRPSPLYFAERITELVDIQGLGVGAQVVNAGGGYTRGCRVVVLIHKDLKYGSALGQGIGEGDGPRGTVSEKEGGTSNFSTATSFFQGHYVEGVEADG